MLESPVPPSISSAHVSSRGKNVSPRLLVFSGGFAFLFFLAGVFVFLVRARIVYRNFGLFSPTYGIHFYRFALFSLLPFIYNALFGAYFGLLFSRGIGRCEESKALELRKPPKALNAGLVGLFAWVILFNFPRIWNAITGGRFFLSLWPTRPFLADAIGVEMRLFFSMGNLGAFCGFFAAMCAVEIQRLRSLMRDLESGVRRETP
jgi:hypothetical protein